MAGSSQRSLGSVRFATVAALSFAALGQAAMGVTVPFTEEFPLSAANWRNNAQQPMTWVASGGPDGSSHITTSYSFANQSVGATPVIIRCQDNFNSSGNAFVGDWIASGVGEYRVWVRHSAPIAVPFIIRFATTFGFPGAIAESASTVEPNVWTLLSVEISPDNPRFLSFSGSDFESVFTDVGRVQIGVTVPVELASLQGSFSFDADGATILPASSGPSCDYDFNQDENVDLLDAQQMAQVFVGLLTPESNWLDGDLNGDENADLTDAQLLAAFVVSGTCGV
jgi:hypothetical protein